MIMNYSPGFYPYVCLANTSVNYSTSTHSESDQAQYEQNLYNAVNEPDYGQTTTNPYILAKRHMVSGKPMDLLTLNSILAFHGITITQQEFDILKGIKPVTLPYPLPQADSNIISIIGKANTSSQKIAGAYILTHLEDGRQYVGGTKDMAKRPRYYYSSKGLGETRPIAKLMAKQGPNSFSLQVYIISSNDFTLVNDNYTASLVLALEQYLILTLKPVLNSVLVVGGVSTTVSGSTALAQIAAKKKKPVYVYNADKTLLLYISESRADLAQDIGIHQVTINRYLTSGNALYNTYILSDTMVDSVNISLIATTELREAMKSLYNDRMRLRDHTSKVNINMHPIKITDLESKDKVPQYFVSKSQAQQYTKAQGRPLYIKHFKRTLPFTFDGWLVESDSF